MQAHGFYATGKFDLQQRDEPYAGIIAACTSLCQDILRLKATPTSNLSFQDMSDQIKFELGDEVNILIKLIPSLTDIVGANEQALVEVGVMEARNHRFNFAFRRFMRVVGRFRPLVLIMDDIQWADVESLDLLQGLITDQQHQGFMMVACYRSNEVTDTHLAAKMIRDVEAWMKMMRA